MASVFLSGAVCLVLEIAGSRLIAPFYGSSIYTWSAMITVTLVALAIGYAWGGRLADRYPHLTQFARLLTAAGLTLAAIPWLRSPVLTASLPLGIRLGALASACVLIGPTLTLLGSLGPVAVRLTATGAADSGRRSGDTWAISTAGSVAGAMLTGFVLIPMFPISKILFAAAALLLALGALGSWLSSRALPLGELAACAACLCLVVRPTAVPNSNLVARESAYGRIAVFDTADHRYLLVNGTSQSVMEKKNGESQSQYVHALEWSRALRPKAARALVIGLGAGLLPKALERRGLVVDSIEIDPAIEETARKNFGFKPRGRVLIGDGRALLRLHPETWDLIFLDAFGSESPPTHLFTLEAFAQVRERLTPDGVFAVNLISITSGPNDRPWKSVFRTLSASFPHVRVFIGGDSNSELANILFFASAGSLDAQTPPASDRVSKDIALMISRELSPSPAALDEVPILSDDFAPLDAMVAATSSRWRRLLQQAMPEVLLN